MDISTAFLLCKLSHFSASEDYFSMYFVCATSSTVFKESF